MQCLCCEKKLTANVMVGTYPNNKWVEVKEWSETSEYISTPNNWGSVRIYCDYGSEHDQEATTPFEGFICDQCISIKKQFLMTNEEENKRIWAERREATLKYIQSQDPELIAQNLKELETKASFEEWLEKQGVDMNEYYKRLNEIEEL